jgi:hypothetical protein
LLPRIEVEILLRRVKTASTSAWFGGGPAAGGPAAGGPAAAILYIFTNIINLVVVNGSLDQ